MPIKAILGAGVAVALCVSCSKGGLGGASSGRGGSSQLGGAAAGAAGVAATGGSSATGGTSGSGGSAIGGQSGAGDASATGGQSGAGGGGGTGGQSGADGGGAGGTGGGGASSGQAGTSGGAGGAGSNARGPCDIYQDAGQPCVAAYSTVRRLSSTYAGPLYQIRSGSSDQNTGSGGETHDIGQTADGFADATAVDATCAGTICTVSLLYDQSGKGNHLSVAKAGSQFAGPFAAMDDFESSATKESLMVAGHKVYPLYTEPRQGYRLPRVGDGIPRAMEPQGVYMLADGTHAGVGCCFDFGNSQPKGLTFNDGNALFFGSGGKANGTVTVGDGDGPWFMWDVRELVYAGGLSGADPAMWNNPNNPSLAVKFALGFLKTDSRTPSPRWALRMADATTATAITAAAQGALPRLLHTAGAVVLGVSADNGNDSWGTFYEGAIVAGFPADDTELTVLQNINAVGYGR
jgi:non-reducing end alpha-L-arabinofuranosidase